MVFEFIVTPMVTPNALSGTDHVYSALLVGERSISILYRRGKRLRYTRYAVATLGRELAREVVAIPGVEYRD